MDSWDSNMSLLGEYQLQQPSDLRSCSTLGLGQSPVKTRSLRRRRHDTEGHKPPPLKRRMSVIPLPNMRYRLWLRRLGLYLVVILVPLLIELSVMPSMAVSAHSNKGPLKIRHHHGRIRHPHHIEPPLDSMSNHSRRESRDTNDKSYIDLSTMTLEELNFHHRYSRTVNDEGQADSETWPVKRVAEIPGDLILGGLHMVHERQDQMICGPVMPQGGLQAAEVMLYTVDRVRELGVMPPGVSLGAYILDDCDKDTYGLQQAVDFIKGKFTINFISYKASYWIQCAQG